jgi:hypothetical protein
MDAPVEEDMHVVAEADITEGYIRSTAVSEERDDNALILQPSVLSDMMHHRDDTQTKMMHTQVFFGAVLFVMSVALAYVFHELSSSRHAAALTDAPVLWSTPPSTRTSEWAHVMAQNSTLWPSWSAQLEDSVQAWQQLSFQASPALDTASHTPACNVTRLISSLYTWCFIDGAQDTFWTTVSQRHVQWYEARTDSHVAPYLAAADFASILLDEYLLRADVLPWSPAVSSWPAGQAFDVIWSAWRSQWLYDALARDWMAAAWRADVTLPGHNGAALRPSFLRQNNTLAYTDDQLLSDAHARWRTSDDDDNYDDDHAVQPAHLLLAWMARMQWMMLGAPDVWLQDAFWQSMWRGTSIRTTVQLLHLHVPLFDVLVQSMPPDASTTCTSVA